MIVHAILYSFILLVIGTAIAWDMSPSVLREVLGMTLAFGYIVWVLVVATVNPNE